MSNLDVYFETVRLRKYFLTYLEKIMILSSKQACQSNDDKDNTDANKGRDPLWGWRWGTDPFQNYLI